jgi:hypothetical protein
MGLAEMAQWEMAWTAMTEAAGTGLSTGPCWVQTGLIAVYAVVLKVLYFLSRGRTNDLTGS